MPTPREHTALRPPGTHITCISYLSPPPSPRHPPTTHARSECSTRRLPEQIATMLRRARRACLAVALWASGACCSGPIGIDVGTANSVVATPRRGGVDVLVNEASRRQTPSLVAFDEDQRLLGQSASSQQISKPEGCVSDPKAHCAARIMQETCGQGGTSDGQGARRVHSDEGAAQERGTGRGAMRSGL